MAEISFELFNNALAQQVVGAQDANLKLLEKCLKVEITSFGNNITIKGDKLDQYIPRDYTPKQREDFIIKACEYYHKRLLRMKQERECER